MLLAIGKKESDFNQDTVSPAGAIGMFQLMPATAKALGVNPHDLVENAVGAAKYLGDLRRRFGSWRLAAAAYNAGPGAVEEHGGVPPYPETQDYVNSVMGMIGGLE